MLPKEGQPSALMECLMENPMGPTDSPTQPLMEGRTESRTDGAWRLPCPADRGSNGTIERRIKGGSNRGSDGRSSSQSQQMINRRSTRGSRGMPNRRSHRTNGGPNGMSNIRSARKQMDCLSNPMGRTEKPTNGEVHRMVKRVIWPAYWA